MDKKQFNQYMLASYRSAGLESLRDIRKVLLRAADEIDMYIERYSEGTIGPSNEVSVLSWVVNYIANLTTNFRLDLLINRAADIASAAEVVKRDNQDECSSST